jgi:hypothetical protein
MDAALRWGLESLRGAPVHLERMGPMPHQIVGPFD